MTEAEIKEMLISRRYTLFVWVSGSGPNKGKIIPREHFLEINAARGEYRLKIMAGKDAHSVPREDVACFSKIEVEIAGRKRYKRFIPFVDKNKFAEIIRRPSHYIKLNVT